MTRDNRSLPCLCLTLAMLSVALTATVSVHAQAPTANQPQSPADDEIMKGFLGRWNIHSGTNQGTPIPADRLKGNFAIVTADKITTFDSEEKEAYKATYTIDTSKSPIEIDMVASRGGQQVKALGIIRLDNVDSNTQKECVLAYSLDPTKRPSSFESQAGDKVMVFHMMTRLPVPDLERE